jgi:hypothetical protein
MGARRLIGATLLAFIFFLPLHQHFFTAAPQFTKECSCYGGARTQASLALAPAACIPSFNAFSIAIYEPQVFDWRFIESLGIRAPPSTFLS